MTRQSSIDILAYKNFNPLPQMPVLKLICALLFMFIISRLKYEQSWTIEVNCN